MSYVVACARRAYIFPDPLGLQAWPRLAVRQRLKQGTGTLQYSVLRGGQVSRLESVGIGERGDRGTCQL